MGAADSASHPLDRLIPLCERSETGQWPAAPPPLKAWQEIREWAADLLLSRTGEDVAAWNRRAAAAGPGDEQALRA